MEQVFTDSSINLEEDEILDLIDEIEEDIKAYRKAGNIAMVEALTSEKLKLKILIG